MARDCWKHRYRKSAGDARMMVKAMSWKERFEACHAYLDWAMMDGEAPVCRLNGRVLNEKGEALAGAGVHVAGFDEFFTLCGQDGRFTLERVPRGKHRVIAAAEGYLFAGKEVCCVPGEGNDVCIVLQEQTAGNIPRKEYNNPLSTAANMAGCLSTGPGSFSSIRRISA